MLNSRPVRLLWHSFNWLTQLTLILSAVVAVLGAVIIITLRYWLLPGIEQFHGKITDSLTDAIGNPVTIAHIKGDWDGLHPHLIFSDVRILDKQNQPALVLPHVDAKLSWLSLIAAEVRLSSLQIDRPELLIRRDAQGKLYFGNIAASTEGSDNGMSNWLLHQSRVIIDNAIIAWVDEQRGSPPLILDQVNLRIENLFSHHRFALHAVPPVELATPLDIRGDFYGKNFDQLKQWHGQLFAQIDYTNILAWSPWLKLPAQLSSGRGALRAWLGIKDGKLNEFTADMALRDVATRLSAEVPTMNVHYLHGRAAWKTVNEGWEVSTRNLTMRLNNGLKLQPTDFYLRINPATQNQPPGGELRANQLQLESLVSLANFFPLESAQRNLLSAYAPRGRVSNLDMRWQGSPKKMLNYNIKGKFENLALQQVGNIPGFSGLSVEVQGNESGGKLNINTRDLNVNAPGIMREALFFNTLTGQAEWELEQGELAVKADNVAVANDDLAGNLYGSYRTKSGTLGLLDLTINLTRGNIQRAARYTPLIALDRSENDWLNDSLLAGHTEDFRLRIKGNLSDFPLKEKSNALLEVSAHAREAAVKFDKNWPGIENISGQFIIHNNRMEVISPSATILDARIHNLSITLPDMNLADLPMEIKGEAEAANNTFLQYIQLSPVRGYINGFTDDMSASAEGHLELFTRIPLRGDNPVRVAGKLRVSNSDLNLGVGTPWLRKTQGELSFTESTMEAHNVTSEILGGMANLSVHTAEGGVVVADARGRINFDALRKTETHPLLHYLRGGSTWEANIRIANKSAQLTLNSSLQGISSSLPAPFTKKAIEVWPLLIEKKITADKQDLIAVQLGKLFNANLIRGKVDGKDTIKSGTINFGGQTQTRESVLDPNGIWLTGKLAKLSMQGWGEINKGDGPAFPIAGAKLQIDRLSGYGIHIDDLRLYAAKHINGYSAKLSSPQANGEVIWEPHGFSNSDKITARMHNLYWNSETAPEPRIAARDEQDIPKPHPHELPALELAVEDFKFNDKQVGRVELVGHPDRMDWYLRRLNITNPDGSLTGDGYWRDSVDSTQTQLNLLLKISNAGKILTRSGYPNTVRNGSGTLSANLSWDGQPDDFSYNTLAGSLKLDTGKGQFLKMEPGIGKLLGILSLQALPKRIALDFTDVFSDGFEFDNINGNATIKHGLMETQDLHIDGSSAKVTMQGQVNLINETQELRVVVMPTLGSSVSMLSAFAAGPMVGIGTLIVSKILGSPLDKLMSFEYNISGTWSDPNVVKLGQKPVTSPAISTDKSN